jgi:hypothetical protein
MTRYVVLVSLGIALVATHACAPAQDEFATVDANAVEKGSGGSGGTDDPSTSERASSAVSVAAHGSGGGTHAGGAGGGEPAPDCVMLNGMNINCDPQDQTPCNMMNGEACDTVFNQQQGHVGFACYPAPNTLNKDQPCPGGNGEFCRAGLHCFGQTQTCKEFCCGDADCTLGGTCKFKLMDGTTPIFALTPTLGLCL